MNASELTELLTGLVDEAHDVVEVLGDFRDLGVLTSNDGFVLRAADGSEFQVTVVQSRGAR